MVSGHITDQIFRNFRLSWLKWTIYWSTVHFSTTFIGLAIRVDLYHSFFSNFLVCGNLKNSIKRVQPPREKDVHDFVAVYRYISASNHTQTVPYFEPKVYQHCTPSSAVTELLSQLFLINN